MEEKPDLRISLLFIAGCPNKDGAEDVLRRVLTGEDIESPIALVEIADHDVAQRTRFLVVTVCGHAHEHCPLFPGKTHVVHVGFDDPPRLAEGAGTEEEALGHSRRVRDEIQAFVETLPDALK